VCQRKGNEIVRIGEVSIKQNAKMSGNGKIGRKRGRLTSQQAHAKISHVCRAEWLWKKYIISIPATKTPDTH